MTVYNRRLEGQLNDILDILGTTKTLLVPGWEKEGSIISAIGAAGFVPSDEAGANALQTYFSPIELPCGLHHYGFVKTENHHFSGADNAAFTFDGGADAPFSGGMWYRPNVAVLAQDLWAKYEALAEEFRFGISAAGKLILELHDATDSTSELATADTVLTSGKFVFVVFTYDGTAATPDIHLYIDGVDDNPTGLSVPTGAYLHMDDTLTPLTIGCSSLTATPANEADGRLAIPFLCGKELTGVNVKDLYAIMNPMVGLS
ncbi:MAG TPA: LamG-like jellyroll fold domain-containing protein [Anaerolineae bacterium]|nr:LamG-like jellyroll fold domain-containing protein [Anaerolineae bacterium]HUW95992.1 LamG-like jellyroll fold domain-containing protein [Anaerolineae bacterium]